MRRPIANLGAFGRALGFVAVAAIVVVIAVHFRRSDALEHAPPPAPSTPSDPLARELVRCQGLGMAAEDDPGCKAAWAENRRRFFAAPPTDANSIDPTTEHKAPTRVEDR
ncbi:putative entry exclusion protein TrbK-alt [Methylocapsa sp. S129]|uniref:putative entry exclusion protein TrbK-alt n=1 Tax=Methylocapsa sp. S129 TaxID=1641869 RepID=UPI00131B7C6B|nr:putative entry exclusion protein TrbK-alt [Methylocapsa sp. S129]